LLTSSTEQKIFKELQSRHLEVFQNENARERAYQELATTFNVSVYEVKDLHKSLIREAKEKINEILPKDSKELDDEDLELIPCRYKVDKTGVYKVKVTAEGEETLIGISKSSFFLKRYFINKSDNTVLVELVIIEKDKPLKIVLPLEKLSNSRVISDLSRYGVHCSSDNARDVVKFLADQFQELKNKKVPSYVVFGSGWFNLNGRHGFALGKECITHGIEVVRLNEIDKSLYQDTIFKSQGNKDLFFEKINSLFEVSPLLITEVGAIISSPLLRVFGLDNAIFHKYSNSSVGKTIGMIIALSFLGKPTQSGIIRRWRATNNGVEAIADEYNDITLALDDLSQKTGSTTEDVYMIGNGQGKQRANKDGSAKEVKSFRLIAISNGEQPLLEDNQLQGSMARVIESSRSTFENVDLSAMEINQLKSFFENNYGFPYRSLIEEIVKVVNSPELLKDLRTDFDSLVESYHAEDNNYVSRLIPVFACMHIALRLLKRANPELRLKDEQISSALSILLNEQRDRLSDKNDLPRRALAYVWEHIISEINKPDYFVGANFSEINHRVRGRGYAILKKDLRKILSEGGFPYQSCYRYFKENNWVWLDEKGQLLTVNMKTLGTASRPYTFDENCAYELGFLEKLSEEESQTLQNHNRSSGKKVSIDYILDKW
jgi:uncharacterized protein (DUF927 family)